MPLITFFRMISSPSSSSLPYSSSYFSSLPSILSYITSHSYQHHHYIQQQSQLLPMLISIKSTVPAQSVENWFGKRDLAVSRPKLIWKDCPTSNNKKPVQTRGNFKCGAKLICIDISPEFPPWCFWWWGWFQWCWREGARCRWFLPLLRKCNPLMLHHLSLLLRAIKIIIVLVINDQLTITCPHSCEVSKSPLLVYYFLFHLSFLWSSSQSSLVLTQNHH